MEYLIGWYAIGLVGAYLSMCAFRAGGLAGPWTRGQVVLCFLGALIGPFLLLGAATWWVCALFEGHGGDASKWWNKPIK